MTMIERLEKTSGMLEGRAGSRFANGVGCGWKDTAREDWRAREVRPRRVGEMAGQTDAGVILLPI